MKYFRNRNVTQATHLTSCFFALAFFLIIPVIFSPKQNSPLLLSATITGENFSYSETNVDSLHSLNFLLQGANDALSASIVAYYSPC